MASTESVIDEVRQNVFENPKQFMDLEYLQSLHSKLKALSEDANSKLKRNVYENYSLFIESAKEVSHLRDDMRSLENLLEQQQDFLNKLLDKLNEDISTQQEFDCPKSSRPAFEMMNEISDEILEEIEPDWFKKVPEDLDIIIAQHEFEEGVLLAKKIKQHFKDYPSIKPELRQKVELKLSELVNAICAELQGSSKTAITSIKLLKDLNLSSKALRIYLNKRSCFLRERSVLKKGSIEPSSQFIDKAVSIFFNVLTDTWIELSVALNLKKEPSPRELFKQSSLPTPALAVLSYWMILETENFCDLLESSNLPKSLLEESKQILLERSQELTKETGISVEQAIKKCETLNGTTKQRRSIAH